MVGWAMPFSPRGLFLSGFAAASLFAAAARADDPTAAPYDAGYALRAPFATTAVRAETAYGLDYRVSSTVVQYLTAAYAPIEHLSFFARGGWVDYLPEDGAESSAFTNVALGGQWAGSLTPALRFAATAGMGLPVGQGGGDSPDAGEAAAIAAGNLARSRLEGSTMFSPNDLAGFAGGDLAWVARGWTLQAEASVFELFRVRGAASDPDAYKTNLMAAVHAGYFLLPQLSIGLEMRDHTYLSTPVAVAEGKASRTFFTAGGGIRAHVELAPRIWFRPGLAYFQPLNDPTPAISAGNYHIVQLDLPLSF